MDERKKMNSKEMLNKASGMAFLLSIIDGMNNAKCHCECDIKDGHDGKISEIRLTGNSIGHFMIIKDLIKGFIAENEIDIDVFLEAVKVFYIANDEIAKEKGKPSFIMMDIDAFKEKKE